jgi:hypothetical protein
MPFLKGKRAMELLNRASDPSHKPEGPFLGADPLREQTATNPPTYRVPIQTTAGADRPRTILEEAQDLVFGSREKSYAHPKVDFARAVGALNAIFGPKLREPFTETDWALVMIICKVARLAHDGSARDGWVDVAGYSETGARVAGIDP